MRASSLVVIVAVLATGCSTQTVRPLPDVQQVLVPATVPCQVSRPTRPAFAVDALPLGAGIYQQMQALRAERLQRQGYEIQLESAVESCQ